MALAPAHSGINNWKASGWSRHSVQDTAQSPQNKQLKAAGQVLRKL